MHQALSVFFGDLIDFDQHVRITNGFGDRAIAGQPVFDDEFFIVLPGSVSIQITGFIDGLADQLKIVNIKIAARHAFAPLCFLLEIKMPVTMAVKSPKLRTIFRSLCFIMVFPP